MTRTRRARPDLSESWDDMDDDQHDERTIYTEDDERSEMQDSYHEDASSVGRSRRDGRAGRRGSEGARRRSPRWSVEPTW
ncbi:hypothetical protein Tdes44962_MAKER05412 [Teratosphaeria destructans]|uniref:Uncharacterized protein n=1 Tax=Teratosphaeria destructans TaxID=418781 RepID=A0A9W7SJU3_9PEZI|nr:hypothetical protein Tdes44962_MAKER05412 [Teratosphaeria destructans]